jgi:hypothetical protein
MKDAAGPCGAQNRLRILCFSSPSSYGEFEVLPTSCILDSGGDIIFILF